MPSKDPPFEIIRIYQPDMDKMVKALRIAAGIEKPPQRVRPNAKKVVNKECV